jgi:hypothetical protein
MSRPNWSVPNQCAELNGFNRFAKSGSSPFVAVKSGANAAMNKSAQMINNPVMPIGFERKTSQPT